MILARLALHLSQYPNSSEFPNLKGLSRLIMKCTITAQSVQTAQLHLGNNRTPAQLKVCIVMPIHNMEKVVVLNMLMANFPKYLNNCPDCTFHKFALNAHFITFSLLILCRGRGSMEFLWGVNILF